MSDQYEFSFKSLMHVAASKDDVKQYADWFKQETIRYAKAAVQKIDDISHFKTAQGQGEAWGDRVNPEYELRRAMATLLGLEEKLEEAIDHVGKDSALRKPLQDTFNEVHDLRKQAKSEFKRAIKWF